MTWRGDPDFEFVPFIPSKPNPNRPNGHAPDDLGEPWAPYDPAGQDTDDGHCGFATNGAQAAEPLPPVDWRQHVRPFDWAAKDGQEPPDRRFAVKDWVPSGCVTSFYGPGGIGKSLAVQMLGTCVALGRPWLGLETTAGRVLSLWCEDPEDELWRRQVRINDPLGVRMSDLGNFLCEGRTGRPNELVIPVQGLPVATDLLDALARAAAELGISLVTLDNIAQMFGCNENDRAAVTSFVNRLAGIAVDTGAAIVLVGHTPKSDPNGSGYSGSTAWNASVRSRLLLDRVTTGDGAEPRLLLRRLKTNYAAGGDLEVPLVWRDGVLRPDDPQFMTYGDRLDAEMHKGAARQAFQDALRALTKQGRNVSHSPKAGNYAPKVMKNAGMAANLTANDLAQALEALLNAGVIVANAKLGTGTDRHPTFGVAFTAAGGE